MFLILLLNSVLLIPVPFSLPQFFGNGMVLQAAPERAQVWGYLGDVVALSVSLNIRCQSGYNHNYTALNVSKNQFLFILTTKLGREGSHLCDSRFRGVVKTPTLV